jgi:hypothetical protein
VPTPNPSLYWGPARETDSRPPASTLAEIVWTIAVASRPPSVEVDVDDIHGSVTHRLRTSAYPHVSATTLAVSASPSSIFMAVRTEAVSSGRMTADEAALGFPQSTLATHTERRAIANYNLQGNETMTIVGTLPPCPSCKGAMNRAAQSTGATIEYAWPGGLWRASK